VLDSYVVRTCEPGSRCYDYTLSRPTGITKFKKRKIVEVSEATELSTLLTFKRVRDAEDIYWYACCGFSGSTFTSGVTAEEASHGITMSASTSIERELMAGVYDKVLPWQSDNRD